MDIRRIDAAIFVVDDNEEVRTSLQWLLEPLGERVATFASALDFLATYDARIPGCLVLDYHMPEMDGIELQNRLAAMRAPLHIIFLTGHATVRTAVEAMRGGADDLFEKPPDDRRLVARIKEVMTRVRAQAAADLSEEMMAARLAHLTPREREVLDKVIAGKSTKVIAVELGVSKKTIDTHRANIRQKMEAHHISELIAPLARLIR